ncbi:MAG: 3-hydroxyacyl-CoA dehydrogenase family protein [Emcibacter sp.]|nr:3-hydroxyacyl-CoA dehydrogenase family protein [Emcibacter sp.]
MGSGIGQVLASSGFCVTVNDLNLVSLERARQRIEDGKFGLNVAVERGKIDKNDLVQIQNRITYSVDIEAACHNADLIIEAVPEDLALKCKLFSQLDEMSPPKTILASNTAGFPIVALAHATKRPEKVIGWHWSQPCSAMKLAEIIRHKENDEETVSAIVEMAHKCRKNPVVINDNAQAWGFVTNRLFMNLQSEGRRIVEEGVANEDQIDQLMKDCFRWPIGIFELHNGAQGMEQSAQSFPGAKDTRQKS